MTLAEEKHATDQIIYQLVMFLGGICWICHKKCNSGKSWTIHHRKYRKGEKTSKDFKTRTPHIITRGKRKGKKTRKTIYNKLEYYRYLFPIVMGRPDPQADFAPLHNTCHIKIGRIVIYTKNHAERERLCYLALEQN